MAEEDESGPLRTTTTTTRMTVAMATTTTTTTTTMGADDVVASTRSVETIEGVAVVGRATWTRRRGDRPRRERRRGARGE